VIRGISLSYGNAGKGNTAVSAVFFAALALLVLAAGAPATFGQAPQSLVGSPFSISTSGFDETHADVAYDSDNGRFIVVWQIEPPGSGIIAAIYNADGTVFASPFTIKPPSSATPARPAIAYSPSFGYLIVWEDDDVGGRDILGATLNPDGTLFTTLNICRADPSVQEAPAVVSTGQGRFLVVWQDTRNGRYELYSQVVVNGTLLGTQNARLTNYAGPDQFPDLAAAANGYSLLVWQRNVGTDSAPDWDVLADLVDPNGLARGSAVPIGVGPYQQQFPAVTYNPNSGQFHAVWEFALSGFDVDIVGALITVDFGSSLVQWTNGVVYDTFEREMEPDIAFDVAHNRYLVVWEHDSGNTGDWDILGRYVSPEGDVGRIESVAVRTLTSQLMPAVAFGGAQNQFWVVWHDNRGAQLDIWGQRTEYVPPVLTVTSPNGGESWTLGGTYTIAWTSSGDVGTTVRIELEKGGVPASVITSSTDNDGAFDWTIPTDLTPGGDYRVRVTDEVTSTTDASDGDFSITAAAQPLRITSPNGGESWQAGTGHTITWTGDSCADVRLELWRGGAFDSTIVSSTPNDGSYAWEIPAGQPAASDYRVRVVCTSDPSNFDESDGDFAITAAGGPTITVTSPNGGESWVRGYPYAITWTSSGGVGATVDIALYKGGVFDSAIASGVSNTGRYDWTIPASQAPGSDYRVRVSDASAPSVFDQSDGDFSIIEEAPTLTVLAPNGGETWLIGSLQEIRWARGTAGATVRIDLIKGGSVVEVIDSAAPNTGSYSWRVSTGLTPASDYRMRITSNSNPGEFDLSDGFFTIAGPANLTVVSPNGGENWEAGTTHEISWLPDDSVNVRIQLYKGGSIQSVIAGTTPNDGSFSWTIPLDQAPGSDYRVKIVSTIDPAKADMSDTYFTISAPRLPDLVIEGFDFSPQDVNGGDAIHFSGRIVNRGDADVAAPFWVEFRVSESIYFSEPTLFLTDSLRVGETLAPGQSFDLSTLDRTVYTHAQGLPDGVYVVGVIVDAQGEVTESDESNNKAWIPTKKLYVGPRPTAARHWALYR